jgi:hypothetical protein
MNKLFFLIIIFCIGLFSFTLALPVSYIVNLDGAELNETYTVEAFSKDEITTKKITITKENTNVKLDHVQYPGDSLEILVYKEGEQKIMVRKLIQSLPATVKKINVIMNSSDRDRDGVPDDEFDCDSLPENVENPLCTNEDKDGDGLIGNVGHVVTNIRLINLEIKEGLVNITSDDKPVLEFTPEKDKPVDMSKLKIIKQDSSSDGGSVVILGINLTNSTKTVYMDNIANISSVCIKDKEVADITEISSGCNGESEKLVYCDGTLDAGYTCELVENDSMYKITGLRHSGVKQQCKDADKDGYGKYCENGHDCNDNNPDIWTGKTCSRDGYTGSTYNENCECTGGTYVGFGSSGTGFLSCYPDWDCSEWSDCQPDGTKVRTCIDLEDCGITPPKQIEDCNYNSEGKENTTSEENDKDESEEEEKRDQQGQKFESLSEEDTIDDFSGKEDEVGSEHDKKQNLVTGFVVDGDLGDIKIWMPYAILVLIVGVVVMIFSLRRNRNKPDYILK